MFEQLLEPFATWDVWTITKWYLLCFASAMVLAVIHSKIGITGDDTDPLQKLPAGGMLLIAGFIMPIAEEVIFRGIPTYLNAGTEVIIAATILWIVLHKKRALIIAPFGLLWIKMWMGGFGVEATAIHIMHNCFLVGIYMATKEIQIMSDMDSDDVESLTSDEPEVQTDINITVSD